MTKSLITIALPKGKLGEEAIALLEKVGLPTINLKTDSRRLLFEYPEEGYRYLICRPTDVPVYVEHGAAALGIVGKDTIEESTADVFELVDLRFGFCKFVVALPLTKAEEITVNGVPELRKLNHKRVATKFPNVAKKYFSSLGMQVEVIKLHGNIELAPRVDLAEMIVDIVSTGKTLKENQLVAVADIFNATARLIANRVNYRMEFQSIDPLVQGLKQIVEEGG